MAVQPCRLQWPKYRVGGRRLRLWHQLNLGIGTLVARFLVVAVLVGCSSYQAPLDNRSARQETVKVVTRNTPGVVEGGIPRGTRYRVLPGDTLFGIAFQYDLDPERLAAANDVAMFAPLKVDQIIRLSEADPTGAIARTARSSEPASGVTTGPTESSTQSAAMESDAPQTPSSASQSSASQSPASQRTAVKPPPMGARTGPIQWQWPVDGKVLEGFSSKQRFSRSLRIAGNEGDQVRAAASGRVVYAGDGLVGLGNLVLIRHDDTWLSAYGTIRIC